MGNLVSAPSWLGGNYLFPPFFKKKDQRLEEDDISRTGRYTCAGQTMGA